MTKARKLIDGSAFDADTVAMMGDVLSKGYSPISVPLLTNRRYFHRAKGRLEGGGFIAIVGHRACRVAANVFNDTEVEPSVRPEA
jgi:hypothetical protein